MIIPNIWENKLQWQPVTTKQLSMVEWDGDLVIPHGSFPPISTSPFIIPSSDILMIHAGMIGMGCFFKFNHHPLILEDIILVHSLIDSLTMLEWDHGMISNASFIHFIHFIRPVKPPGFSRGVLFNICSGSVGRRCLGDGEDSDGETSRVARRRGEAWRRRCGDSEIFRCGLEPRRRWRNLRPRMPRMPRMGRFYGILWYLMAL